MYNQCSIVYNSVFYCCVEYTCQNEVNSNLLKKTEKSTNKSKETQNKSIKTKQRELWQMTDFVLILFLPFIVRVAVSMHIRNCDAFYVEIISEKFRNSNELTSLMLSSVKKCKLFANAWFCWLDCVVFRLLFYAFTIINQLEILHC